MENGWIGVDLDGTLAMDLDGPFTEIGPPVAKMLLLVRLWIADGTEVKIMTARVANPEWRDEQRRMVEAWCEKFVGVRLEVTNEKDLRMKELWDDRAVQVVRNEGSRVGKVYRR